MSQKYTCYRFAETLCPDSFNAPSNDKKIQQPQEQPLVEDTFKQEAMHSPHGLINPPTYPQQGIQNQNSFTYPLMRPEYQNTSDYIPTFSEEENRLLEANYLMNEDHIFSLHCETTGQPSHPIENIFEQDPMFAPHNIPEQPIPQQYPNAAPNIPQDPTPTNPFSQESSLLQWQKNGTCSIKKSKDISNLNSHIINIHQSWTEFYVGNAQTFESEISAYTIIRHAMLRMQEIFEDKFVCWSSVFYTAQLISSWSSELKKKNYHLDWFAPFVYTWKHATAEINSAQRLFEHFEKFHEQWNIRADIIGINDNVQSTILSMLWSDLWKTYDEKVTSETIDHWTKKTKEITGLLPPFEIRTAYAFYLFNSAHNQGQNKVLRYIYDLPLFKRGDEKSLQCVNFEPYHLYQSMTKWLFKIDWSNMRENQRASEIFREHLSFLFVEIKDIPWNSLRIKSPKKFNKD